MSVSVEQQVNYTLTNLAEHLKQWSHDTINRYLRGEKLSPGLLFEQLEPLLETNPEAYLIFDDTVLEKSFGPNNIEPVRRQWSGNDKSVIWGIGVVSLVYVNPNNERFWVIDYRIFTPDGRWQEQEARACQGDAGLGCASGVEVFPGADGLLVCHQRPDGVDRRDMGGGKRF